jgi:signal transduction histidine kinase
MQTSDTPFLTDWFTISLRWACLLGFAVALSLSNLFTISIGVLLLILAIWNLMMSMLAIFNLRLPFHRYVNVMVDTILTLLVFIASGNISGPLFWSSLVPLISAAIYFNWGGSLVIGVMLAIFQIFVVYLDSLKVDGLAWGILALVNIAGGVISGVLSILVVRRLRMSYQTRVHVRHETESQVQKKERDRMQAVYKMIETLSGTLNYNLVLDTTLDLSSAAVAEQGETTPAFQKIVSAVLLFGQHDLHVACARKFPPPDLRRTFPVEKGALRDAIQRAEPVLLSNPDADPELGRLLCIQGCRSSLILPLRRGLDAYGVIFFAHPDPGFFTPSRLETLEMLSHQAVIAIQNARLYQEMELEKKRIIETQEEARKQLARDLHDGPTQSVAAIAMRLNIIRMMLDINPTEIAEELAKLEDLARRTTQEIRHMLFTLRPLVLETSGLIAALQMMADKMRETYSQNVVITADQGLIDQIEAGKQTVIFYIVEEAVNNARKYANASQISVSLNYFTKDHDFGFLEVVDDGMGFDVKAVNISYEKRGSLGMVNLRERTDLVNGLLQIDSSPGKGTCVKVIIPLNEGAADRLHRGLI